jgi:hypothetical protein
MLGLAGVILGFLLSFFILYLFGWTSENSSFVARLGIIVLFPVIGIIIGIAMAGRTQAHYEAAAMTNPAFQQKVEDAMNMRSGRRGLWRYIVLAAYIFLKAFGYYGIFAHGYLFSPNARLQVIIEAVIDGIVALVFLVIYLKNRKRFFAVTFTFFLLLAIIDCVGLVAIKSIPMAATPSQTAVEGQGQRVSLGELLSSLGQFSIVLPSGFRMVFSPGAGGDVSIAPIPSTPDSFPFWNTGPYFITVAPGTMTPQEWANGEKPVFQQAANSTLNDGKNIVIVTSTVLFGYPAEEIFSIAGEQTEAYISFEQNGVPFVVGIAKASNVSDSSSAALNKNLDAIWATLEFGTTTAASGYLNQRQ